MTEGPNLADLPERLRLRVVSLVAEVLPAVTPLPPALRKVSGFAPTRRARLGGSMISTALADEDFRHHAGVQVEATPATPDDAADEGARAWLSRPAGWQDTVADVVRRLSDQQSDPDRDAERIERLRAQVTSLQEDLRVQRAEHKTRLDEAKAENTTLRRRLGETRQGLRSAEEQRDVAIAAQEEAIRLAETAVKSAEAEARRLRGQLGDATVELSSSRQGARSARDTATMRARLLLDTLIDSATGLSRELGLPTVEGTPGEAIEADLLGQHATRTTSAPSGPGTLEQVLALPRSRLIIDGYNVTKTAWQSATLEAQRSRLITALAPVVARTGAETTIVFDAASSTSRPVLPTPRGLKVVYSPAGVIADDVIRRLVIAEPAGRVVVVVTNDQAVVRDVVREGARAVPSETLIGLLTS